MRNPLRRTLVFAALLLLPRTGAAADSMTHRFGNDLFAAGEQVVVSETGLEDVYAAGESVSIDSAVSESVHAAGRNVRIERAVGRDLYAAGFGVDVGAPVSGDVVAGGYQVTIAAGGSVGDDALLAGRLVAVHGAVGGNARIAARNVEISAPITGSVEIRAREIRFRDGARIGGTLDYWSPEAIELPPEVIAADRVTFHRVARAAPPPVGMFGYLAGGLAFLTALILLGALFAFLFRGALARSSAIMRGHPWYTLLFGAIATSTLFGSLVVFGASVIGVPLLPLVLILIPFLLLAGYLTTAHLIGRLVLSRRHGGAGTGAGSAFLAILVGVLILAVLGWIPLLGWVIGVFAIIFGLGPWFLLAIAPRQRTTAPT
jgi:cytoskeletal protein CcmA (bactofilin family)